MKSHLKYIILIIFSTIAVYYGSLNNDFVQEDYIQIVNNGALQSPSFFLDILRGWRDISAQLAGHWRPVYYLSYFIDYLKWLLS